MLTLRLLQTVFLIALALVVSRPALADCTGGAKPGIIFFVTDRAPLKDDQLFSGERGLNAKRLAVITRGTIQAPVSKRRERRCAGESSFFGSVAKSFSANKPQQILIYVHGYYTTFNTAAEDALSMQRSLQFSGPVVLYSWPSKSTSRLAYVTDETNASWSLVHFRVLLARLRSRFTNATISFSTHSLGARFAAEGMSYLRHSGCAKCLGRTALFAPDMDGDALRGELAAAGLCNGPPDTKPKRSAIVSLYVSNKDLALRQSQRVHGHQRAGQAGSEMLLCNGVDTVDVSYFKSSDKAGHSYQTAGRILNDMRQAFAGLAPISPGRSLKRLNRTGGTYYEFKP
ncbi:MAG: alpha/beta hydrolase [Candidatus Eremiobacteraeota bacterium]|nr:alpha/beta hydrolase [Candidatus Eremiobacteraeota bacterium]